MTVLECEHLHMKLMELLKGYKLQFCHGVLLAAFELTRE